MRLIVADALMEAMYHMAFETDSNTKWDSGCWVRYKAIEELIKEQPSIICGYNIEHLVMIATILHKEGLSPDNVKEAIEDINRIIAIVRDEFEESLRKAFEQTMR